MIWLGALGLVLATALGAVIFAWRGNRRGSEPVTEVPAVERRRTPAAPALSPDASVGDRLRDAVKRQREQAGRLTAGHVQLIDVGAMIEGSTSAGLSPVKALKVAEEVARQMIRPSDILVRMDPDGVAILFDGISREEAEARSQRIADATVAALGEVGAGGRYLAEGFGYELDEVMDGALIDSVEDLIRFVHIAHRGYVAKQRGVARELEQGVSVVRRPVMAANGFDLIGYEMAVFRRHGKGDAATLRDESFSVAQPALGAETDCVVLEKLTALAQPVLGEAAKPIYVPIRLTSLVNPLYFDNIRSALDSMPPILRQRLVPVIDPGDGAGRTHLPRARELLRSRVLAIAVRVTDPAVDIAAAAAGGATTVILDGPERRFEKPEDMVARFRRIAREAGLTPIVLGAGDVVAGMSGGVACSLVTPN
ncbi:hypothetical protein BAL199_03604 [alpha proteobacterium BAL199]|jgi:hypothetical protein|nr:hypothetical protein BAL199_03604 [alpha proteobacterium BAL199]